MKLFDAIFSFVVGVFVAWLASDFLKIYSWAFFILLPILSVALLDLAKRLFRKLPFVEQAAKFVLVGGFADIVDIKAYQILFFLIPASILIKSISFLIAVTIKYAGNKLWVFDKTEKHAIKEAGQFFVITIIGLLINVSVFYCLSRVTLVKWDAKIWTEISIIIAALAASVWNFLGYKLLVFKNKK